MWLLHPPHDPRPRWWVRAFVNPLKSKKGRGATIRNFARIDTFPFNKIIEDFCVVNNAVGDVVIGTGTIIGIGSAVIGPVEIGDNTMLAQNVVVSGLNHSYEDVTLPPSQQKVTCKKISISSNVWIGANSVITAGITIGKHAIVGGGSVVTRDIPPYCVAVGNPARIVKKYNQESKIWEKI